MTDHTIQNNFRLDRKINSQVMAFCKKAGICKTDFYKEATIEKLTPENKEDVLSELTELRKDLLEMRMELATLSRALLRTTTSQFNMSDEDIQKWLKSNLKHHSHVVDF